MPETEVNNSYKSWQNLLHAWHKSFDKSWQNLLHAWQKSWHQCPVTNMLTFANHNDADGHAHELGLGPDGSIHVHLLLWALKVEGRHCWHTEIITFSTFRNTQTIIISRKRVTKYCQWKWTKSIMQMQFFLKVFLRLVGKALLFHPPPFSSWQQGLPPTSPPHTHTHMPTHLEGGGKPAQHCR